MSDADLCYLSALELRRLYRGRELSPVEVTEAVLRRMDRLNPHTGAYITPTPQLALDQAIAAEAAYGGDDEPPPLAGIPVSLKDLTVTKGIRTTRGSLLYKDWVPDFDAPIATRLREAGAVLLGKTNTPEMGWKGDTSNRLMEPTQNPWKRGHTPGGSSGGAAAAVALGMGPLAQGTDGAGSVRIPAAFSGVFGFKPSWGRVPQYPASAVELLSHTGPLTRTVRDAALMLDAMVGADPMDRLSLPAENDFLPSVEGDIQGLKVAWSADLGYAAIDPEVRAIAEAAARRFEELGCEVVEAHPQASDPWEMVHMIWSSAFAGVFIDNLDEVRERLDPGLLAVIEQGLQFTAAELSATNSRRNEFYHTWRTFMDEFDLVLTPTLPVTAFAAGDDHPGQIDGRETTYLSWTAFTYPINVTGQPAASVPCGFDDDGLPVGLQIIGRWRDDISVLRAAAAFEEIAPWADQRPPDPVEASGS